MGNLHVVGRRGKVFELLLGEDVDGDKMDFGVAMLPGLGGGHFDDLARAALDDDEAVLPQRRALLRVGGRGTGIGALKGVFMLRKERTCQRAPSKTAFSKATAWWRSAGTRGHVPAHHRPW